MRSIQLLGICSLATLSATCDSVDDPAPTGDSGTTAVGAGGSSAGGSSGGGGIRAEAGVGGGAATGGASGSGDAAPNDATAPPAPDATVVVLDGGEPCDDATFGEATAPMSALEPIRIVEGAATPMATTSHGWLLYRRSSMLAAIRLSDDLPSVDLIDEPGMLVVKGPTAFYWTSVNYTTGRGDLMVWSGWDCARRVTNTLNAEDLVDASSDGRFVLYPDDVTETTHDIILATRDLTRRHVLVDDAGRGSEETCRARYGFAGDRVVVGACAEGTQDATVAVFDRAGDGDVWTRTQVGTGMQPAWAADATGTQIFLTTVGSQGRLWTAEAEVNVDDGIAWGVLKPDGSRLFYLVGDQLRSTPLPDLLSIPVMTHQFNGLVGWSPDLEFVVYSTEVDFEAGEQRDLLVARTDRFSASPLRLVPTPRARVSRSVFTEDGQHVLYLEGRDPNGAGTLHAAPLPTGPALTRELVDTVAASRGSQIVLSDNRSDPARWPVLADLSVWSVGRAGSPEVLQTGVVDGRNFRISVDGGAVIYERPTSTGPGAGAAETQGIWWHPLPTP